MGDANFLLGIEIQHATNRIYVSQEKYIIDILREANLMDAREAPAPFPIGCKLQEEDGGYWRS